jgi:adenine-specific DNA-methyltransferase
MWQSVTANVQDGHAVPSQYYTIISPSGVKHDPPKGRCWIYNKEKMDEEIKKNNIWFGLDGKGVPRVKKFLSERKVKGLNPETIWLSDIVGTTDSAKKHLKKLFPNNIIFETPKPEDLIKHIFDIATNENDIILDCYLGSGSTVTTAHKMNRKYIGIEIGEHIIDLVSERLKMVIGGEIGGISTKVAWKGGGDFALYEYK